MKIAYSLHGIGIGTTGGDGGIATLMPDSQKYLHAIARHSY